MSGENLNLCGETSIGGYPIKQSVCTRQNGHEGWHVADEGDSWPAKEIGEKRQRTGAVQDAPRETNNLNHD